MNMQDIDKIINNVSDLIDIILNEIDFSGIKEVGLFKEGEEFHTYLTTATSGMIDPIYNKRADYIVDVGQIIKNTLEAQGVFTLSENEDELLAMTKIIETEKDNIIKDVVEEVLNKEEERLKDAKEEIKSDFKYLDTGKKDRETDIEKAREKFLPYYCSNALKNLGVISDVNPKKPNLCEEEVNLLLKYENVIDEIYNFKDFKCSTIARVNVKIKSQDGQENQEDEEEDEM